MLVRYTSISWYASLSISLSIVSLTLIIGILVYTFKRYHWESGKDDVSLHSLSSSAAQLLSSTLYQRRLFPYYSFTLLGGIDAKGRVTTIPSLLIVILLPLIVLTGDSFLYKYDAVGSFERVHAVCSGRLVNIY